MHKLISTVFLLCGISAGAYAGNKTHTIIDGGMVHLRGGLVEAGCTLSTNSENDVIDMGNSEQISLREPAVIQTIFRLSW